MGGGRGGRKEGSEEGGEGRGGGKGENEKFDCDMPLCTVISGVVYMYHYNIRHWMLAAGQNTLLQPMSTTGRRHFTEETHSTTAGDLD